MNPRDRYLASLLFSTPDRIPLQQGDPRQSTLDKWNTQGLDKDRPWFAQMCAEIIPWRGTRISNGCGYTVRARAPVAGTCMACLHETPGLCGITLPE